MMERNGVSMQAADDAQLQRGWMTRGIYAAMFLFVLAIVVSCAPTMPEREAGTAVPEPGLPSSPGAEPVSVSQKPEEVIPEVDNVPAERLSFSWEKDSGPRVIDGSVPFVHALKDGKVRLYYCSGRGILSAVSQDGLVFQKEGLRIDSETNGDNGWASVPDAIILPDGRVRMYYVTAAEVEHGIGSAIYPDGLDFVKEPGIRIPNLVDPASVSIGGRYVLFAASIDERFGQGPKGIYYAESSDGLDFGGPTAVFQGNDVYDPSVLKIDEETVRVFYGKVIPPQPPAVESHTGKMIR